MGMLALLGLVTPCRPLENSARLRIGGKVRQSSVWSRHLVRTSGLTTTVVRSDDRIVPRAEGQGDEHIGTPVGQALQLGEGVAARVPIRLLVDERNPLGNIAQMTTLFSQLHRAGSYS